MCIVLKPISLFFIFFQCFPMGIILTFICLRRGDTLVYYVYNIYTENTKIQFIQCKYIVTPAGTPGSIQGGRSRIPCDTLEPPETLLKTLVSIQISKLSEKFVRKMSRPPWKNSCERALYPIYPRYILYNVDIQLFRSAVIAAKPDYLHQFKPVTKQKRLTKTVV